MLSIVPIFLIIHRNVLNVRRVRQKLASKSPFISLKPTRAAGQFWSKDARSSHRDNQSFTYTVPWPANGYKAMPR